MRTFIQERMVGFDGTDGYCCQHGWILVRRLRL
jgi:hypothetical protein